jgi:hypothetical protein
MGTSAPAFGSAGNVNAFGTAGTSSLGNGISSGMPSISSGASTGIDWAKQGQQMLSNMQQQQAKQDADRKQAEALAAELKRRRDAELMGSKPGWIDMDRVKRMG